MKPPAWLASGVATRFAGLTRARAAAVVGLFLVAQGWFMAAAMRAAPGAAVQVAASREGGGDVAFYKTVVARVRGGEGYYDVLAEELPRHGYPVRPAFAWRQPTYAWLLSRLPSPLVANALLAVIGAAVVWSARRWVIESGGRSFSSVAVALMVVTMSTCFVRDFVFLQESWAGALIALSVCLSARRRWPAAVAAGFAALAFREFALLPCAVSLVLALRRRHWPEVCAWLAGLAIYALLMSWHLAEVTRHLRPGDVSRGWTAMGGAAFLIQTYGWSPLFVALPRGLVALAVPFVMLGLAGWRDEGAARAALIVFGFMAAFSVVGHPFNDYWGAVFAPLLPFGLLAAPSCVRDLGRALSRPRLNPVGAP